MRETIRNELGLPPHDTSVEPRVWRAVDILELGEGALIQVSRD